MNMLFLRTIVVLRQLLGRDEGQDLVEYTLMIALIALGIILGSRALAAGLNQVFQDTATTLTTFA